MLGTFYNVTGVNSNYSLIKIKHLHGGSRNINYSYVHELILQILICRHSM